MTMHFAHMIAHFFVGVGTHASFTISVPPVPIPAGPHMSTSTLLGLTINAKFSPRVLGMGGIPLCGRGNDSGFFIPHFDLMGNWTLIPVVTALAGSKIMFGSSKTKILLQDGDPKKATDVGCSFIPYYPASLNQECNDPCNYPCDSVCAPNTVMVGMTFGDFVGGIADIAFDTCLSFLLAEGGGAVSKGMQMQVLRHGSAGLMLKMANNPRLSTHLLSKLTEDGAGKGIATLFGLGFSEVQGATNNAAGGDIIHEGWSALGDATANLIIGDDGPANDPRVHRTSDSLSDDPNIRLLD